MNIRVKVEVGVSLRHNLESVLNSLVFATLTLLLIGRAYRVRFTWIAPRLRDRSKSSLTRGQPPPLPELLPGGDQLLNRLRTGEVPWADPAYEACPSVEALQRRDPITESFLCCQAIAERFRREVCGRNWCNRLCDGEFSSPVGSPRCSAWSEICPRRPQTFLRRAGTGR